MWKGYRTSSELTSVTSRIVSRTLRVTLNEYASNFESLDWDKHHFPDAFFEIISQFYYYIFGISVALSSKNKTKILKIAQKARLKFQHLDHLCVVLNSNSNTRSLADLGEGSGGPGRPFYFGWKKKEEERKKDENHASP